MEGTGLKELAALEHLTALDLSSCEGLTDAGFKELSALKHLTSLDLWRSPVTDTRLKKLDGLKDLAVLKLGETHVTKEGAAEFQKALPKCKIIR